MNTGAFVAPSGRHKCAGYGRHWVGRASRPTQYAADYHPLVGEALRAEQPANAADVRYGEHVRLCGLRLTRSAFGGLVERAIAGPAFYATG